LPSLYEDAYWIAKLVGVGLAFRPTAAQQQNRDASEKGAHPLAVEIPLSQVVKRFNG
jgi:hypothetical protein